MVINQVTTLSSVFKHGFNDGITTKARFNGPSGLAVDQVGNVVVVDSNDNCIKRISPEGIVSILAGGKDPGFKDGNGVKARFQLHGYNAELALDNHGNAYLADVHNHCIRKITSDGQVSTVAGTGEAGYLDGPAKIAQFYYPTGLTIDDERNIFVADMDNHCIRKITPTGDVSTLAGSGKLGFVDGVGPQARFHSPAAIATDLQGRIIVSDSGNHRVRSVSTSGEVSTLAGNGKHGDDTGSCDSACFNTPHGLTVDGEGNIIVADSGNHRILNISENGMVSVIAGCGDDGFVNRPGKSACFDNPIDLAITVTGDIIVADNNNNCLRVIAAHRKPPSSTMPVAPGPSNGNLNESPPMPHEAPLHNEIATFVEDSQQMQDLEIQQRHSLKELVNQRDRQADMMNVHKRQCIYSTANCRS